jgi:hypothetical protein
VARVWYSVPLAFDAVNAARAELMVRLRLAIG